MTFVYIIRCKNGVYYTGITSNLKRRISEHNSGIRSYTQPSMRPVELIYSKEYSSRVEAAKIEKEIKGWSRTKKENLINSVNSKFTLRVYIEDCEASRNAGVV